MSELSRVPVANWLQGLQQICNYSGDEVEVRTTCSDETCQRSGMPAFSSLLFKRVKSERIVDGFFMLSPQIPSPTSVKLTFGLPQRQWASRHKIPLSLHVIPFQRKSPSPGLSSSDCTGPLH